MPQSSGLVLTVVSSTASVLSCSPSTSFDLIRHPTTFYAMKAIFRMPLGGQCVKYILLGVLLCGASMGAVTPLDELSLSIQRSSSNLITIAVPTIVGRTNLLETTRSLLPMRWRTAHAIQGTGEVQKVIVPLPSQGEGFYRLAAERKTSLELIEEAFKQGKLNAEESLVYRVYVLFQDERLPLKYRGDDSNLEHFPALDEAALALPQLSNNAQAILRPFFVPPAYVGSWADRYQSNVVESTRPSFHLAATPPDGFHPGWAPVASEHVKVWYRTFGAGSISAKVAMDIVSECEVIWSRLESLFELTPRSDSGQTRDGGDRRLDIYIFVDPKNEEIHKDAAAVTVPFKDCAGPRFILMRSDKFTRCVLAHEMTHAFVAAFPRLDNDCERYHWLNEATAAWAEQFVFPLEKECSLRWADEFLSIPDRIEAPLDETTPLFIQNGHYVFLFYVAKTFGSPAIIQKIWRNCETMEPLAAIDAALKPAGLKNTWPPFVLANWNRPPYARYPNWNGPHEGAYTKAANGPSPFGLDDKGTFSRVEMNGKSEMIYTLDFPVDYLAARYYRFIFNDINARSVAFYNPLAEMADDESNHASVQAVFKIEGQGWRSENWSYQLQKTFCRDQKAERLEELVIIIGNSDWQNKSAVPAGRAPKLMVNNIGCWRWTGEARVATQISSGGSAEESAAVHQLVLQASPNNALATVFGSYSLVGLPGFSWSGSETIPGLCKCSWGASSYQSSDASVSVVINNYLIRDVVYPKIMLEPILDTIARACWGGGGGWSDDEVFGTGCPVPCGGFSPEWSFRLGTVANPIRILSDGTVKYDAVETVPGGTQSWHATLTPLRE